MPGPFEVLINALLKQGTIDERVEPVLRVFAACCGKEPACLALDVREHGFKSWLRTEKPWRRRLQGTARRLHPAS